jgi:hypothetical protein
VARNWRRQHYEELHYASPNIVRVIKSSAMWSARHVARLGRMKIHTRFWPENLKGSHSEGLGVDGRIILEWYMDGFTWLRTGASGGTRQWISRFHKRREFIDWLSDC